MIFCFCALRKTRGCRRCVISGHRCRKKHLLSRRLIFPKHPEVMVAAGPADVAKK
jgi:hypothetical protein